jgi:hypothetical protein
VAPASIATVSPNLLHSANDPPPCPPKSYQAPLACPRACYGAYAPASERLGTRLETFFIALCVALGDIDGKPFSVARIASYVRVPRTTVIRRLNRLQSSGLIDRQGRRYYIREKTLNSLIGMRRYEQIRCILSKATQELTDLDTLPG